MLALLMKRAPHQSVLTASDVQAKREQRRVAFALMLLALPIVAFWVVTHGPAAWDPTIVVPAELFIVVSAAALAALAMAVVLGIAATDRLGFRLTFRKITDCQ